MEQEVYGSETGHDKRDQGSTEKIKTNSIKAEKTERDSKGRGKAEKSVFIVSPPINLLPEIE